MLNFRSKERHEHDEVIYISAEILLNIFVVVFLVDVQIRDGQSKTCILNAIVSCATLMNSIHKPRNVTRFN
jgi:hypothetical protein